VKGRVHADFVTPEYRSRPTPQPGTGHHSTSPTMFEVCRGMGRSFGYNRAESEADFIGVNELIDLHDDVIAAGGNLLLNVGPMPDGTIPNPQLARLRALGAHRSTRGSNRK
jgi:alpha-L-fucosidase